MIGIRCKRAALAAAMTAGLLLGQAAQAKEFIKMSTLGPGSSPYLVMTTFASIVNSREKDIEVQVNATGVATRHAIEAGRGEIDMFLTAPIINILMRGQKAMFKKVKDAPALVKNLRVMLMFDIGLYHVAVYDDSGIRSLKDIKGKKVFLGPPGGAALRVAKTFVKAATGYEAGKDFDSVKLSWDAAGAAFQDRRLDVYINPTNPPSPVIQQVALTNKIRFLPLEDAVFETPAVKKLFKIPGRTRGNIAAKAYGKNQMNAGPTQSMGALVGVATRAGMSADTVYRMTKAFWEGAEEMRSTAPWLREIKLENALSAANIPLHPGAAKYYREIGMKVPEKLLAK